MPDWSKSMQRTYEYYIVDPGTWKDVKKIDGVKGCTIDRDSEAETRGSANFDIAGSLGEYYVRTYLITIQNGVTEKHPLGTHLVQTPSSSFDGKSESVSADAYTSLVELKENPPPIGYYVDKGKNIMEENYKLIREHARAPVVKAECDKKLEYNFVAETNDTWLSYTADLASNAKYTIDTDELGRIIFPPEQDTASLQPVWTYNDDNSSILYPDVEIDQDLYGIPNVVEVVYSNGTKYHHARVVNDDPNSPISTINRGREICYRVTDPDLMGEVTENSVNEYAEQLLRNLSTVERTITYSHGYCPVRPRDCVRLNYSRYGLNGVKAKVISQSIECTPECKVTEKAVYTANLWKSYNDIPQERYVYSVKYDANGGIMTISGQTKRRGTPLTLTTVIPTKKGYKFAGWGSSPSSTNPLYFAGSEYKRDSDIKLYAIWEVESDESV